MVVYSSARHRNRVSPGTHPQRAGAIQCSSLQRSGAAMDETGAQFLRGGPRVPHARGNGDVPRAPTALARFSARLRTTGRSTRSNGSNKHNRTSLGSPVQESGIEVAPARLQAPGQRLLSAKPKRTAPATFGRPGLMSLRSGSMPLAPDRDRCRVVARFPYPQGVRPINADPLDSFEWTEVSTSRPAIRRQPLLLLQWSMPSRIARLSAASAMSASMASSLQRCQ